MEKVNEFYKEEEHAISVVKKAEILYSDEALVKVSITGDEMLIHQTEEPYVEFTKGVLIQFYDPTGNTISTLTALKATRYEAKQQTVLEDSVVFKSLKNEQMKTSKLVWDEAKNTLSSDRKVQVKNGNELIKGTGFSAKQDFSWYKIHNITGVINVKDN